MMDLQSHSTYSDGELPPAGVVAAAVEAGVTTLALTDHDGIDGVAEAGEAASAAGIVLIPATEISCVHGSIDDMHMLGYWVDTTAIAPSMERAQRERVTRARGDRRAAQRPGRAGHLRGRDRAGRRCLLRRPPAHREGGRA